MSEADRARTPRFPSMETKNVVVAICAWGATPRNINFGKFVKITRSLLTLAPFSHFWPFFGRDFLRHSGL